MTKHPDPTIKILKWGEYNYRKDVKRPSWFRFDHSMIEDSQFYSFSDAEWKAWTYLLSIASQRSCDTILVNLEHAERVCRIKPASLFSAIEKLVELQIVHVVVTDAVRARTVNVTDACSTLQDNTVQDITNTTARNVRATRFDFDHVYSLYPRKMGKAPGIKRAQKEVHTEEDYLLLSQAVARFAEHHRTQNTEPKFIPYFSTFMSSWRDWIDPSTGTAEVGPQADPFAFLDEPQGKRA